MSSMPHRCEAEPMPALARVTWSLLVLMYSISSATLAGAKSLRATIVIGTSVTRPTGAKASPGL